MTNTLWNNIVCVVLTSLIICHKHLIHARGEITVSAPVNPVDQGGILSVYCHLSTVEDGQTVQIFRTLTDGKPELIAIGETILTSGDERMFLAVRQLTDGSFVYLFSIMSATIMDSGTYQCKIVVPSTLTQVAEGSVEIDFVYFPVDGPSCHGNPELQEGAQAKFTCTSDEGNPPVSISWEKSGSSRGLKTETFTRNGRVGVDLHFKAKRNLNNVVFTCKISSVAFPGKPLSCHVGPLTITPRSSSSIVPIEEETDTQRMVILEEDGSVSHSEATLNSDNLLENCEQYCSTFTSKVIFWIITTAIAAIVAIIFCIIVIVLFIKYSNMNDFETVHQLPRHPPHGIYDELTVQGSGGLDRERCKMYMSLERSKNTDGFCEQVGEER